MDVLVVSIVEVYYGFLLLERLFVDLALALVIGHRYSLLHIIKFFIIDFLVEVTLFVLFT